MCLRESTKNTESTYVKKDSKKRFLNRSNGVLALRGKILRREEVDMR